MRHSRGRACTLVALLLPLFSSVAGCQSGVVERSAERELRRRLPRIIGPAQSYRVQIRAASDFSILQGRLRTVTIEGHRVLVSGVWPVDHLFVIGERVHLDTRRRVLERVGSARFAVTIRPATLTHYLEEDEENLRAVSVSLEHGNLTVSGRYLLMGLWTSFQVTGTLVLLDSTRIGFETSTARAAGISVPRPIVRYLEQRLNPVLDVSKTILPLQLMSVIISPEGVTIHGVPHLEGMAFFEPTDYPNGLPAAPSNGANSKGTF